MNLKQRSVVKYYVTEAGATLRGLHLIQNIRFFDKTDVLYQNIRMAIRKRNNQATMNSLKKIGLFSTEEALRVGVSKATLYRLVQDEQINKVGSGLFSHPHINLSGTELDYAIACRTLGPHSVVGGLTALVHYQLTEQVLQQIWVLVPPSKRGWNSMYRCLRTSIPLNIEVENRKLYRIVNMERALIEGLRYATKIGLETALTAIRTALREKKTKMSRLETAATNLNLKSVIVKHWEAIIS